MHILEFILTHTPFSYLVQSLWRDEAFSYFMARPNFAQIIINTANDFNPPFYYLLLHVWMWFIGKSDEGLRLLSLLFHLGSVYVAYLIGLKLFPKKNFAKILAFFTLINPMLLYYGFEIRMYSLYALLAFLTYYLFIKNRWKKYIFVATLGLYTHSFFPLLIASLFFSELISKKISIKKYIMTLSPFIFFLPWVPVIVGQFLKSESSWVFPVDLKLILSSLGNIFSNYDGTPWNGWTYTGILSAGILGHCIYLFIKKKKDSLSILIPIFLPLLAILTYSIIKRPLYVNRYLIFICVFEIIAISSALYYIPNKFIQKITIGIWSLLLIYINIYLPPFKKKTDFKTTFYEINRTAKSTDYAFAQTPIGQLETAYYFKNEKNVFVYNPQNVNIPNYIGVTVVFPNSSRSIFPTPPSRTFLIHDDASFDLIIQK